MKHIKKIDELYKATYMNASDKLKDNHTERSKTLADYSKRGINYPMERIFPYAFIFSNYKKLKKSDSMLGKYYITNFEFSELQNYRAAISVIMTSTYGNIIRISIIPLYNMMQLKTVSIIINYGEKEKIPEYNPGSSENLKFESRRDAAKFREFLIEIKEELKNDNEANILDFDFLDKSKLKINDMWTSNFEKKEDEDIPKFNYIYSIKK